MTKKSAGLLQQLEFKMEDAAFSVYREEGGRDADYAVDELAMRELAPFRAAIRMLIRNLERRRLDPSRWD
jgi:hypothetical protein